jgi:hypothetical protein
MTSIAAASAALLIDPTALVVDRRLFFRRRAIPGVL